MLTQTYGHTPIQKMFDQADVYGVGYDEARQSKKKVRLGIIGFGGVALSKHAPAIARLQAIWEPVELAAVCCRNEKSGRRATEIYGAKWYPQAEQMLHSEELDGVLICSPDELHFAHAQLCLEKGLPVLVEKPLTATLREADALCRAADKAKLPLMTVSNKRYSPPYWRAKSFLQSGILPNPALFIAKFNLGYSYVNILEGGTVHVLDLMRYFMGDVTSCSAVGTKLHGFNKTGYPFDHAAALFTFASGAAGAVYTSNSALSLKPWELLEIYGEKKWLKVDDQYSLWLYDTEEGPAKSWAPVMPNTLFFDEEFGGFMGLIENFCNVIRGLEAPMVTGWDGYRALELVYAYHLAVKSGEKIKLPLDIETAEAEMAIIRQTMAAAAKER